MSQRPLTAPPEAVIDEPLPEAPPALERPQRSGWRRKVQEEIDRLAAVVALISRKEGEEQYGTGILDSLDQLELWLDSEEAKERGKKFVRTERTGMEEKYLEAYEWLKAKLDAKKQSGEHAYENRADSGGNAGGLLGSKEG